MNFSNAVIIKALSDRNLIPFKKGVLVSKMDCYNIESTIKRNIEWAENLGLYYHRESHKKYEGFVKGNSFRFRRIIKFGHNSFIPILSGNCETNDEETYIRFEIMYPKWINITLIVFLAFFLTTEINSFRSAKKTEERDVYEQIKEIIGQEQFDVIYEPSDKTPGNNWTGIFVLLIAYTIIQTLYWIETKTILDDIKFFINAVDYKMDDT